MGTVLFYMRFAVRQEVYLHFRFLSLPLSLVEFLNFEDLPGKGTREGGYKQCVEVKGGCRLKDEFVCLATCQNKGDCIW